MLESSSDYLFIEELQSGEDADEDCLSLAFGFCDNEAVKSTYAPRKVTVSQEASVPRRVQPGSVTRAKLAKLDPILQLKAKMADDPYLAPVFSTPKGKRRMGKVAFSRPLEMEVGVFSNDISFQKAKMDYSLIMSTEWPADLDPQGRTGPSGVTSNFYSINHVSGYSAFPATYPAVSNMADRSKIGLTNGFKEVWHRNLFRAMVRQAFTGLVPRNVKLRVGSSSMNPLYISDVTEKISYVKEYLARFPRISKDIIRTATHPRLATKISDAVRREVNLKLFQTAHYGAPIDSVYRNQSSDGVTLLNPELVTGRHFSDSIYSQLSWEFKKREVNDLEYALSGGKTGGKIGVNKVFSPEDGMLPGVAMQRLRNAQGVPLGMNALLMPVITAVRERMYSAFGPTFHTSTRLALLEEVTKWHSLVCTDVSNHDWYYQDVLREETASVLLDMGFDPAWVETYYRVGRSAMFVTGVGPGEGNIMIGDWLIPDLKPGMTSGMNPTDTDGNLGMSMAYAIAQIEHTYPECIPRLQSDNLDDHLDFVSDYWGHKLPIFSKLKSDDGLLGWDDSDPVVLSRIPDFINMLVQVDEGAIPANSVSPYMKIGIERGSKFLGSVLSFDREGSQSSLRVFGDIESMMVNAWSNEYSIESELRDRTKAFRPYPALGFGSWPEAYGSAPAYAAALEVVEFVWRKHYGESYRLKKEKEYSEQMLAASRAANLHGRMSGLSPEDQDVMRDPSKIGWKYSEDQVSKEVVDLFMKGLSVEEILPFFSYVVPEVHRA
jgi:hypothetical protein